MTTDTVKKMWMLISMKLTFIFSHVFCIHLSVFHVTLIAPTPSMLELGVLWSKDWKECVKPAANSIWYPSPLAFGIKGPCTLPTSIWNDQTGTPPPWHFGWWDQVSLSSISIWYDGTHSHGIFLQITFRVKLAETGCIKHFSSEYKQCDSIITCYYTITLVTLAIHGVYQHQKAQGLSS